jgi:peptidoglycan/xylan/chitin deacetylase (PgdA/CDA1 family)
MHALSEPRRWRPSPLITASVAWHAAALVGTAALPQLWPWALATVIADHVVLGTTGLLPRSRLLGPNWTHLPQGACERGCVALTIDDGPDPEVTPQVLALLAAHGVRATFFCIGTKVARHRGLAREIVAAGHHIENHSEHHRHTFSLMGPAGMRAEVERAQESIAEVTGRLPRFFRAPAGLRNPFLEPVLARAGLWLASWTRRGFDTVNRSADDVLARLSRGLAAGDILLLHDGGAARGADGTPIVMGVLPRLLATLAARRLQPVTLADALP